MEKYYDKNKNEIHEGMTIIHDDGTEEIVILGENTLGVSASKQSGSEYGQFIYPLSEFDLNEWSIKK